VNLLQAVWHAIHAMWWPQTGQWSSFWSGIGSNLAYLAIIGALWHRLNCHTRGCWRIARQQVDGTTYHVCRRHHPAGKPTHNDVLEAHIAARIKENPDDR
jgi:hypothetical protein